MAEEEKKEKVVENKEEQQEKVETGAKEIKAEEKPKKKKKLLKIAGIALAVIISLLIILSISLGVIVKGAVNHILPKVTGTPTSMDSCYINLLSGSVSISNFVIGNPEGYKTPHAFKLGEVYVDLDVASLMSDKIVIQDITVDNMEVSFETKITETNIGVIKENIDKLSKKDESTEPEPDKKEEPEEKKVGGGKKLQIDNFMFINSKVHVQAQVMDTGAGTSVPLPEIKITGIGSDSDGGASIPEISEEVFTELYLAIIKSVKSLGNIDTEALKESTGKAFEKAKEGTDSVIKGVKGLFGGEEE